MPGLGSSWQHLCCQIASQERVLSSMMSSVMKGEVLMMTKSSSVMKGEAVDAETFQGHVVHKPNGVLSVEASIGCCCCVFNNHRCILFNPKCRAFCQAKVKSDGGMSASGLRAMANGIRVRVPSAATRSYPCLQYI